MCPVKSCWTLGSRTLGSRTGAIPVLHLLRLSLLPLLPCTPAPRMLLQLGLTSYNRITIPREQGRKAL